jgi:predicted ATPase
MLLRYLPESQQTGSGRFCLRFEVLGPVRVLGEAGIEVGRPSHRRLLSVFALAGGDRLSADALMDRFWPQSPPDTARAALQTHVAALRRLLGDDVIVTEAGGYRLNLADHALDVDVFTTLGVEAAEWSGDREWESGLQSVDGALALWRGEPYVELADDGFARPEITRLHEQRLALLELRAEALIGLDRAGEALPDLEAWVLQHPLRERLWEHLMTARYRLGRHAEALRAFREVSEHLAEIGVEPGERLRRLEEKVLFHDRSLMGTRHNLPLELDSFIGRDVERGDVAKLLGENRLVTLTGAGGSGKTRLAANVARAALDDYPDGVWLVELAALRDPDLIPTEVARVIGIKPRSADVLQDLTEALVGDRCLIILDNCEHLSVGPARVAEALLRGVPELDILATSRAPLRVPGEATYDVPGLSLPSEAITVSDALDHAALVLFADRSSLGIPSFSLNEDNIEDVALICHRLDGMPLAIELAAARAKHIPLDVIADRLDSRFQLLTDGAATAPERHQTLEATIDWSYQLLTNQEQAVLRRLSVFRGGFDIDMAETVGSGEDIDRGEVVAVLSSLAEESLVVPYEWRGGLRYRLLETVRAFTRARLEERGEADAAGRRLQQWCLTLADDFWTGIYDEKRQQVVTRAGEDLDNLVAAVGWTETKGEARNESRLLSVIAWLWLELGYVARSHGLMARAIDLSDDRVRRAEMKAHQSYTSWALNDPAEAWAHIESAYEVFKDEPPSPAAVYAISYYANLHWILVDRDARGGLAAAAQGVRAAIATGNVLSEVRARTTRSTVLVSSGQEREGLEELDQAMALLAQVEDRPFALKLLHNAITTLMTVRSVRRTEPRRVVDRMVAVAESVEQLSRNACDWVAFVWIQTGEWEKAREILEVDANTPHLEASDRLAMLIPRATLLWMQGDLAAALSDVREAEALGVNPRWYHDFLSLKAEIATDRGELDETREVAGFYLGFEVDSSEVAKKLGTLHPLVRAEVDAAMQPDTADRAEHVRRAEEAFATMRRLLEEHPAPSTGSYMAETHDTHLTFARAELSRLGGSNPELWQQAFEEADFIYYRLYAQWRLAEALLNAGELEDGEQHLADAHSESQRIGAKLLVSRVDATAATHDLPL